jgi:broad specificity phosphatase PhoE
MNPRKASLWLIASLLVPAQAFSAVTVFLTRHAERAGGAGAMADDDPLSPAGRERADLLARMLSDAGIQKIFVSEYKRTQETAAPLARKLNLAPEVTKNPADAVRALKTGVVLVVGHSNTLPEIIKALGGPAVPKIDDAEFDNLYILTISGKDVSLTRVHYGAPKPLPRIAREARDHSPAPGSWPPAPFSPEPLQ